MPLFARTYPDLMADSLADLASTTRVTRLTPGGIARALLESSNARMAEGYKIFDLGLARAYVSSAPGQFLELIGMLLDVQRGGSVAASVDEESQIIKFYVDSGTFGTINGGNPITISQNSIISTQANSGGILYRVTNTAVLPAGGSSGWVAAEAIAPGERSNVGTGSLIFHNFTGYVGYLNDTLKVTNIHPVATGRDIEGDTNYRYRLVNKVTEAEAANQTAIRLATLSTAGVADVVLIPRYRGIGTFGVIIKSVTPTVSSSLLDTVTFNVSRVQAFGDISYVRAPKESGLAMKLTGHYSSRLPEDELSSIESSIRDIITSYVNNLDIGEEFLLNKMVSSLFNVSSNLTNLGIAGQPVDELYIYRESKVGDNRVKSTLLGDYLPSSDERVIIEQSLPQPITLERSYTRR